MLIYCARLKKCQIVVNIKPTYSIVGQLYKNMYVYCFDDLNIS